jgi:lysophospholipase L1-like esterase
MRRLALCVAFLIAFAAAPAQAQQWVASWTGAAHGPYPLGNATAQPELKFAFPTPVQGARDQTFRLIVKPGIWGPQTRIRLSNAFGLKPVTFDDVFIGLQESGSAVVPGTNAPALFKGRKGVSVMPGDSAMSDPVPLPFVKPGDPMLSGRKLSISFHVAGDSGPMTWHAKALQTSYVSSPGSGSKGAGEGEAAFPFSSTSWYFLDALEMFVRAGTKVIVALGDSITDGAGSTVDGDDRWTDVLSRRLHAVYGDAFVVVNQGIDGNRVARPAPADYAARPIPGGPAAIARLDRDVLSLSGVTSVIWGEGIDDFAAGSPVDAVIAGYRQGVAHIRRKIPGVKIFAATLTTALNSTPTHSQPEIEARRQALNDFLRESKDFDGVIDFDAATLDATTGELKAMYQPSSSTGGPGDKIHPNRAGYAAMGNAIDLKMITGR